MGLLLQTYESGMMITIMQLWYDTKLVSRMWQTLESDMMLTILNFGTYLYKTNNID